MMRNITTENMKKTFLFSDITVSRYVRTRFTRCDVYRLYLGPMHVFRIVVRSSRRRFHGPDVRYIRSSHRREVGAKCS